MNALSLTRRLRPVLWTLAALCLIALVAWRAVMWSAQSTNANSSGRGATDSDAKVGLALYPRGDRAKAPKLEGITLDGDTFALSDLTGKVVVINVWGSWCAPCRAETPELVRLARQYASRGVRFVGINTRDNLAAARSFQNKFKVPYPSVRDDDGRLLLEFRKVIPTAVVPSSVLIDRQGNVAARIIGRVTYSTLNGLIEDELAASGSTQ